LLGSLEERPGQNYNDERGHFRGSTIGHAAVE
jgi:hypothetical protein